jgi:FtsP/CotA-like multicopper oxidase with cupredoxin domain
MLALCACGDKAAAPATSGAAKIPYDAGVEGLPEAKPMGVLAAGDGDTVRLRVSYVAKRIAGVKVRMLAYNGSVPGPLLKVPQGATIVLLLENGTDLPTSLHSHGVRLGYGNDGVPGIGAGAVGPGDSAAYHIRFPDAGIFWYHPHTREDYQMELGLYGGYLVQPADPAYWPRAHRDTVLFLDDIAVRGNVIQPFYRGLTDHALMGRFGNVLLVNGDPSFTMRVKRGELIRFYVVDASNARVYNLLYSRDMDLNILGADNGRFETPNSRENYVVAPSERAVFQLLFNDALDDYDTLDLWNATPAGVSTLARFIYEADTARPDLSGNIAKATFAPVAASIDPFRPYFDKSPDEEILLTGYMDMSKPLAKAAHDPDPNNTMGVEWNDSVHGPAMVAMNDGSSQANTHWAIRDLKTGKENHAIDWTFRRGDKILIRVHNDTATRDANPNLMMHPMPHPLHFHGQRFLVVRENGKPPLEGLAWRDSYLIGRGYTVDLLLDADNPGEWMFHCHIAEHLEDDMMGHFRVLDTVAGARTPYEWSLSLAGADSLRRDTILAAPVPAQVTGSVNARPAAGAAPVPVSEALDGKLYLADADDASLRAAVPLDGSGRFSFVAASVLGNADIARVKAWVRAGDSAYRPAPDTLRLTFDRRGRIAWSLDLDLAGEASFTALRRDTSAVSAMAGQVTGKVNGFDPGQVRDTLHFRNKIYPELFVDAPLAADGSFAFDAFDLVGSLDGLHSLAVFLRTKNGRLLDPDTVRVDVSVP